MSDFAIGLQVTGLGMALVFLTLVLIMLAIMLLDRLFRPAGAVEQAPAAPPVVRAAQPAAREAPPAARPEDTDLIAALAVAVVAAFEGNSQQPGAVPATPEPDYASAPAEVITVARIDPGTGDWSGQGRITALN